MNMSPEFSTKTTTPCTYGIEVKFTRREYMPILIKRPDDVSVTVRIFGLDFKAAFGNNTPNDFSVTQSKVII